MATVPQQKGAAGTVSPARIPGQVDRPRGDVFLGRRITPLTRRRLDNFRANRRGFWSLWIFLVLFGTSLFAEFLANDRPLLVQLRRAAFTCRFCTTTRRPPLAAISRAKPIIATRRSIKLITDKGWMVWPLIPFSYRTITDAPGPFPAPPSRTDWLGTDDQGRDVLGAPHLRVSHLGIVRPGADPVFLGRRGRRRRGARLFRRRSSISACSASSRSGKGCRCSIC